MCVCGGGGGGDVYKLHGLINESCFEIEKMPNVQNSVISPWACLRGNRVLVLFVARYDASLHPGMFLHCFYVFLIIKRKTISIEISTLHFVSILYSKIRAAMYKIKGI